MSASESLPALLALDPRALPDQSQCLHADRAAWQMLIVLDALRYDAFIEVVEPWLVAQPRVTVVDARPVRTPGTTTPEWLKYAWPDRYPDVTYVAGTPWVHRVRGLFGKLNAWMHTWSDPETHFAQIIEAWDEGFRRDPRTGITTVLPDAVARAFLRAWDADDTMRYVVHFMQPHAPYIGAPSLDMGAWKMVHTRRRGDTLRPAPTEAGTNAVRAAYRGNVERVLEDGVSALLNALPAHSKVVLTADHGEMLGEYGEWGHCRGSERSELRVVPWADLRIAAEQ